MTSRAPSGLAINPLPYWAGPGGLPALSAELPGARITLQYLPVCCVKQPRQGNRVVIQNQYTSWCMLSMSSDGIHKDRHSASSPSVQRPSPPLSCNLPEICSQSVLEVSPSMSLFVGNLSSQKGWLMQRCVHYTFSWCIEMLTLRASCAPESGGSGLYWFCL